MANLKIKNCAMVNKIEEPITNPGFIVVFRANLKIFFQIIEVNSTIKYNV